MRLNSSVHLNILRQSYRCLERPGVLQTCQVRYASSRLSRSYKPTFKDRFKEQWRLAKKDYPIVLPVLVVATVASISLLGLLLYDDYTRVSPQFAAFPTAVEFHLRKALQNVHVTPDPDASEYHYRTALRLAKESFNMDPFGPDVLGIRIALAEMLEKFGRIKSALEVLDEMIQACQEKLADIDRGTFSRQTEAVPAYRQAMLKTIIRCRVKAATLYEVDRNPVKAKAVLSETMAVLVKETQDPQTNGFSANNAAGLSLEEIASMLSQMGDLYATTGEEANAIQVYMLTLSPLRQACNGTRSCREVQVLSNIASTMDLAMKKPGATINGQPANKASLAAARRATLKWVDQAIATAEVVLPEDRDEICALALLSAELTKADLLLEDGKLIQAREAFRSLIPRLREKGLVSLVKTAEQGIRRAEG